MALRPIGFWSYTRDDDARSRGRLSQLRGLLADELQGMLGRSELVGYQASCIRVADLARAASNEDMIGNNVAGPAFQIAEQCVADILREWQAHLVSPFPCYLQRAVVPIDVGEMETRHISGAQS